MDNKNVDQANSSKAAVGTSDNKPDENPGAEFARYNPSKGTLEVKPLAESDIPFILPPGRPDFTTYSLTIGGLFFMLASLAALIALIYVLFNIRQISPPTSYPEPDRQYYGLLSFYLSIFMSPILLFSTSIVASVLGYCLLRAAGTGTKQVIPLQDYKLLSQMLLDNNHEGISSYIALSSLTGLTGFFTKIGLTGLPLATITLTVIFALAAIIVGGNRELFDLAKLTLGAFIGSYVQRQATDYQKSSRLERHVMGIQKDAEAKAASSMK
jgi:hypothetical protein